MQNRQLVHYDTAGQRVIIQPGDLTNVGGDVYAISPGGAVTSVADVPNTIPVRDAAGGFEVGYLQVDTTPPVVETSGVGKIIWNDTDGTLEVGLKGGNVTLDIGQEEVVRVKNDSGVAFLGGEAVYISGSNGNNLLTKLANANSEATSAGTIGIVTEPIAANNHGFIATFGLVRNVNTNHLTEGAPVWLATVNGQTTSTRPTAPNHGVLLGFCLRKSATVGAIFVRVDNGWELDELHNVLITGVAAGDLLVRNAGNTLWENKAPSTQPWVLKAGDTMTGPLSIGSSGTATNLQLSRAGTAANAGDASIFRINASITAVTNGDLYAFKYDPTFVKAASGVHGYFLSVNLQPPVISTPGGSTATVTNAVTLYVANAPTGATNVYAMWIAAGLARFGGQIYAESKIGIGTASPTALLQVSGSMTAASVADGSLVRVNGTITALNNGDLYAFKYDPTFVKGSAGTHAYFMGMNLQPPTITTPGGSTAAITNAITLFVGGAPTAATNNYSVFVYAGTTRLDGAVSVGGIVTPTARLHIAAGTASANTAPLKLNSGTNLTVAESGAMEYDGTDWYLTDSTPTRRTVDYLPTVTSSATPVTVPAKGGFVRVVGAAGAKTVNLPALTNVKTGTRVVIKDSAGNAAAGTITITPNGTDTIDGAANATITTNYGVVRLFATGSAGRWEIW